jgi:hypothetical protein
MVMNLRLSAPPTISGLHYLSAKLGVPILSLPISTFAVSLEYIPLGGHVPPSSRLVPKASGFDFCQQESSCSLPKHGIPPKHHSSNTELDVVASFSLLQI